TSYLITWSGYNFGLLLSSDQRSSQQFPLTAAVSRRVVSAGGRFAVASLTDEGLVIFGLLTLGEPGLQKAINSGVQSIDIATRGNDYAVIMTSGSGVSALTVDNNGGVYPTVSLDTVPSQTPPAVTAAGNVYLAAWMTPRTNGGQQLCTARFAETRETPICSAVIARLQRPAVSASSTTSLLGWSDSVSNVDRIKADVVPLPATPSARAEDPITSVVAQAQGAATIGLHSRGMLLAWSEYNSGLRRAQLVLGGVAPDGRQLAPRPLAEGDGVQVEPRISLGNQQALIVWTEIVETAFRIRGVIVDADGVINPLALEIGNGVAPSVAFNGQSWIVIWQSQRFGDPQAPQLLTTAISATGLVFTRGGNRILPTTTAQLAPEVVWTGTAYVTAWDEVIGFGANEVREVASASLDSSGNFASGRSVLAHIEGAQVLGPWLATANGQTGVSWFTAREGANPVDFALLDDRGSRLGEVRRLATLPFPILDGRLRSSYAGSFAFGYLYDFNTFPPPPRGLTVFRFAPDTGAILSEGGINADVTDFDFVYAGEQVVFSYARQMAASERYGNTTRAFIRTADPVGRRRIGGH
ncbi:MAG: cell wall/surface repeat protein, partial [Acidobacteria bacterium]|nr:cell wall/surface repeat protein [Acidobacteriota bacterium]